MSALRASYYKLLGDAADRIKVKLVERGEFGKASVMRDLASLFERNHNRAVNKMGRSQIRVQEYSRISDRAAELMLIAFLGIMFSCSAPADTTSACPAPSTRT